MERFRPEQFELDKQIMPVFFASSIYDLQQSRDQVWEEYKDWILIEANKTAKTVMGFLNLTDKANSILAIKKFDPTARSIITIPMVRHLPQYEPENIITLEDQTGIVDTHIPNPLLRKFLTLGYEDAEEAIDWKEIKENAWVGDVVLYASVSQSKEKLTLLYVENYLQEVEARENNGNQLTLTKPITLRG